jgi:hypothetical protein
MYDPYKHWQYLLHRRESRSFGYLVSRVRCRIFGLHDFACRGRRDHSPERGHWLS